MRASVVKMNINSLAQVAKYAILQGAGTYVDEVIVYWSINVNPIDLHLPPAFFEQVVSILKGKHLAICTLTKAALTNEDAKIMLRPTPDTANCITKSAMGTFAKEESRVNDVEELLKFIRVNYEQKIA